MAFSVRLSYFNRESFFITFIINANLLKKLSILPQPIHPRQWLTLNVNLCIVSICFRNDRAATSFRDGRRRAIECAADGEKRRN